MSVGRFTASSLDEEITWCDKIGKIEQWTDWQGVKETYDHIPVFSKQVSKTPAERDLSGLPEGFEFPNDPIRFELPFGINERLQHLLDKQDEGLP